MDSLLVSITNIEEVISAATLLCALVRRVDSTASNNKALAQGLTKAIINSVSGTSDRKVAILSVLYNMVPNGIEKCHLLQGMIQLAATNLLLVHPDCTLGKLLNVRRHAGSDDLDSSATTGSAATVKTSLGSTTTTTLQSSGMVLHPSLVTLLDLWQIPAADRRAIYTTIVQVLPAADIRKQQFLLLLIDTYKEGNIDAAGQAAAKEAAIGAIRDPVSLFHQQRNMLQKYAIRVGLQKVEPKLFALLQIFLTGVLQDYESFVTKDSASSASWGIDIEIGRRYMRILSLCTLASAQEQIAYSDIKSTLNVDEVETWVIAAVNSGLLVAKMDQLSETVIVEKSVLRKFDIEHWQSLQKQLATWKNNVGSILSALATQQQQQQVTHHQQ
jgi:hypothetical protein